MPTQRCQWYSRIVVHVSGQLVKSEQVPRTLRIFLSHSVEGQPWQSGGDEGGGMTLDPQSLDFASGQGIPSWTFKVEGRLLDTVSSIGALSFLYHI